jgi:hypothetical protein
MEIGQDPICGAEKKGGAFSRRIKVLFHDHKKFKPYNFESD